MRRVWFVVVALAIVAGTGGQARGVNGRCAQALSRAPSLPAPIVVTTRCGRFRFQPTGTVVYKGPRTSPVPKGSNYFMDLTWYRFSRSHHLLIGRGLEQLWRSHDRYPATRATYIGAVVLGARQLSFNYTGRLYVASYDGRERLVARGEQPVAFFSGDLLSWRLRGFALVLRGAGTVVVPHAVDPQWDRASGMVVFRTGRRLRAFDGRRVRLLANRYQLGVKGAPVVEPLGQFVSIHDTRRIVVVDYEGRVVASASLPKRRVRADGVSSSVVTNAGGSAVAFTATHRSRGTETVYVLAAGARRVLPVFTTQSDFSGCGYSASLEWHGKWLLYSNAEPRAAIVAGTEKAASVELTKAISRLPGVQRDGPFFIAWAPAP
jgi:hypothetical protein